MRNITANINLVLSETDDPVTEADSIERLNDGSFKLVISQQDEFNIDRVESAVLQLCYPAMRTALSEHFEQASKKKPAKKPR